MSRAVSIRGQLKKYMQRFNLPLQSCEGDAKRLRKCLVAGYWRNGARWTEDGTYRSVRGNIVRRSSATSARSNTLLRFSAFIQTPCCLRASHELGGLYFTKSRRPRRHSTCSVFW
ncbi:hypothetical protein EXIGLDRAFT_94183 [Exidia glandulosa HHB12029]|uniref:Uncharacterized protein n=1 Tax=Exidia glandulosa HHB12029 TaxID=1314781 RepID=A0A165H8L4_EXIGL|nr:hypothetical protein EXIGLDRAFT_94183 [Exidia glandulosa HHB12029]